MLDGSQKLSLNETELDYLESIAPIDRILAVWRILLTAPVFDSAESIDPTKYAIPESQWSRIIAGAPITIQFQFMNAGPSAYSTQSVC